MIKNGLITSNGSVSLTSNVVVAREPPYLGTKSQIPKPPKRKFRSCRFLLSSRLYFLLFRFGDCDRSELWPNHLRALLHRRLWPRVNSTTLLLSASSEFRPLELSLRPE